MLARDEFDPDAPVAACRVEEVFVREGLIWELTVGGRTIRTTAEHPHYVPGRGWAACHELRVGDRVLTELGTALPVEALRDTRSLERVYNFRVADTHTYFVGAPEWGFAVWVHNAYSKSHSAAGNLPRLRGMSENQVQRILSSNGFILAKVSKSPARNQTWIHPDGSVVKIHPFGNEKLGPYRSGNNAHVHKVDGAGNDLTDRGLIGGTPSEIHIGIVNPSNLPLVRGRIHGA